MGVLLNAFQFSHMTGFQDVSDNKQAISSDKLAALASLNIRQAKTAFHVTGHNSCKSKEKPMVFATSISFIFQSTKSDTDTERKDGLTKIHI